MIATLMEVDIYNKQGKRDTCFVSKLVLHQIEKAVYMQMIVVKEQC